MRADTAGAAQVVLFSVEEGSVRANVLVLPPPGTTRLPQSEVDRIVAAAAGVSTRPFASSGPVSLVFTRLPETVAPEPASGGLSLVVIIAICAGGGVALVLAALVAVCLWRRRAMSAKQTINPSAGDSGGEPVAEAAEDKAPRGRPRPNNALVYPEPSPSGGSPAPSPRAPSHL